MPTNKYSALIKAIGSIAMDLHKNPSSSLELTQRAKFGKERGIIF